MLGDKILSLVLYLDTKSMSDSFPPKKKELQALTLNTRPQLFKAVEANQEDH